MRLVFELKGQCLSGKNHKQITRTGHCYPTKRWAAWRDEMVMAIKQQDRRQPVTLLRDLFKATVVFTHADKRRRDVPGMLDALCHVLERAGIVKDDSQIVAWDVQTNLPPCRELAGVTLRLETL